MRLDGSFRNRYDPFIPMSALLFDFDGVLVDTFEMCYRISVIRTASLTPEGFRERFYGNVNTVLDTLPKPQNWDFFALYAPELMKLPVYPEMQALIQKLAQQQHPLFIVSSTTSAPIKAFLAQHHLLDCFQEIYGNDIDKSKERKIRLILERTGLPSAEHLFITDTLGDIREASACNVRSIAVSWGFHTAETLLEGHPLGIATSVPDLQQLIAKFSV